MQCLPGKLGYVKGRLLGLGFAQFLHFWGAEDASPHFLLKINQLQSTVQYSPCISYTLAHIMSGTCWQNYLQNYLYSEPLTFITAFVLLEPLFWFQELVSHNCLTVARGRALLNNLGMCMQNFLFKNSGPPLFSCSPTQEPAGTKFHAATHHQGGVTQSYPKNQNLQGCVLL